MKTYHEKSGFIEPEIVEINPTPKEKLQDLENLTLEGDAPIKRVLLFTGNLPADRYTRVHPCQGEGKVKGFSFGKMGHAKNPRMSINVDLEREKAFIEMDGSRSYKVYFNPLNEGVEENYTYHLSIGNLNRREQK